MNAELEDLVMNTIEMIEGQFCVDAALIADGLGLDPSALQSRMREGYLTSLCERGIDDDAGRFRLTFFHARRRLSLIVDDQGNVIERSVEDADHGTRSERHPGVVR